MVLRLLILLSVSLAVVACAPQASPPQPSATSQAIPTEQRLGTLVGAEVETGDPLQVRYPGETLFAEGAVLPLPGGTAVLDPLADLLLEHPASRWRGVVRAQTGNSPEYDQALAEKRAELLRRYFEHRGIPADRLELSAEAAEGAPLELILVNVPDGDSPAATR